MPHRGQMSGRYVPYHSLMRAPYLLLRGQMSGRQVPYHRLMRAPCPWRPRQPVVRHRWHPRQPVVRHRWHPRQPVVRHPCPLQYLPEPCAMFTDRQAEEYNNRKFSKEATQMINQHYLSMLEHKSVIRELAERV